MRFLSPDELAEIGLAANHDALAAPIEPIARAPESPKIAATQATVYADSVCKNCGGMLIQTGSCKTCLQCGGTTGGC